MKTNKRQVSIVLAIIIIIPVFALIYGTSRGIFSSVPKMLPNTQMQTIPRIETSVISKDGVSHTVDADVILAVDDKSTLISADEISNTISDTISNLDYDKIDGTDKHDYVKSEIKDALSKYYTEDQLKDVFLTGLATDMKLPNPANGSRLDKAMKGLFKNMD